MYKLAEKRQSLRISAAFVIRVCDYDGNVLAQGRTANTSENGVFAILDRGVHLPREILLELHLPDPSQFNRRNAVRKVLYEARVVREQVLGNLIGVGVQLLRKVE